MKLTNYFIKKLEKEHTENKRKSLKVVFLWPKKHGKDRKI